MRHDFPFDPTYGYGREALLKIEAPASADGFAEFWRDTFAETAAVPLRLERGETVAPQPGLRLSEVRFVFDLVHAGEVAIDQIGFSDLPPAFLQARVDGG